MAADNRIEFVISAKDSGAAAFSSFSGRIVALNNAIELGRKAWNALSGPIERVLETTDRFRRYNIILKEITGSTEGAQAAMAGLQKLAIESPAQLTTLTDAFVKLKSGGIEDAQRTLSALTNAVAAFGGSDADITRAAVALQQMGGKGVASMEELRQQLGESVPTAIKIMAEAMGLSMAEFSAAVAKGSISSKDAIKAFTLGAEKAFSGRAKAMMDTWTGATSNFSDAWDQLLKSLGEAGLIDKAIAAVQGLTRGVQALGKWIQEHQAVVKRLFDAFSNPIFLAALAAIGLAFVALTGPLGLLALVAVGLVAVEASIALFGETVQKWFVERFNAAVEAVGAAIEKVKGFFRGLYDSVVGHSYVPDLVNDVIDEFDRMGKGMEKKTRKGREGVEAQFKSLSASEAAIGAARDFGKRLGGSLPGVGGAIAGFQQGGPIGAGVGFLTDLLMQDPEMQEALKELSKALVALVKPIAEVIAPILLKLAPAVEKLEPAFVLLAKALELYIAVLQKQIELFEWGFDALIKVFDGLLNVLESIGDLLGKTGGALKSLLEPVAKLVEPLKGMGGLLIKLEGALTTLSAPINSLAGWIRKLVAALGGGGGGAADWLRDRLGFAEGGRVTASRMLRLPGMESGAGLILAHEGENVQSRAEVAAGGGLVINLTQHFASGDPAVVERATRRLLERLLIERKLALGV